ncbi:GntR family transcriptional regulator [Enhydrobacter aerosaccus]|uniref:GntR family transcriptional regulator n=1 Tax=Enhydrobacter aerosaccus TaxID=225324 RepID=A0A1T4K7A0_9HYPH|nr:GntR family transcriptional regulator [Enhydrobacter aerosaccus]SJZ38304.1 GntR family transcriptional regulator [Enhydrobacter aerosaccus]
MSTSDDPAPLYSRVHAAIREAIREGRLAAGALLPSEKELEAAHGVSRITVRRALDELEREGLITRGRGRQAKVVEPLVSRIRTEIEEDLAAMLDLVRGTEAKVLSASWRLVDAPMRATLQAGEGEPVLQVDRLRSKDGKPIMHTRAHVPAWIGAKLDREALAGTTMLELLARAGVRIAGAEQAMRAAPCPKEVAPLIGLSAGDPVFIVERLVRDDRDRPIQHLLATFRWDSFSYRIRSTRSAAGRVVEISGAGHVGAPAEGASITRR